jgi:DeoR family fructose operon transcriptional repressor
MSKLQIARTLGLCELLDTSDATVRRDLEWLEQEGFLERLHGGMMQSHYMTFDPKYIQRTRNYIKSLLAVTNPIPV